jgi:hypothetical protein
MLHDLSVTRIDIDSTSLDVSGTPIAVDDIVVSRLNSQTLYCQCKKNQQDFRAWSPADLQDDLKKAARQLARDSNGLVHFYSATPFGDVAKLAEHAATQPDAATYGHSLGNIAGLRSINSTLESYWLPELAGTNLSVFDLLHRISFHSTAGLNELQEELLGALGQHATQAGHVLDVLLSRLASIKSRTSASSSGLTATPSIGITRDDLLRILSEVGSLLTPPRAEHDLLAEFRNVSAIGRSWRRDIGSKRLPRKSIDEVFKHIQEEVKRVLVTDGPGSGKTCVLLDLADRLETDPVRAVLFVQARLYSECRTPDARRGVGLPDNIVEDIGRLAEYRPVVVILDSLDVLSLAREHEVLDFFLGLIDRVSLVPRVTVVAACRTYDLQYDHRLKSRNWGHIVALGSLDWDTQVLPLLQEWSVDQDGLPMPLRELLVNPRMLAIFEEIVRRGAIPTASTAQELTEHYLQSVVLRDATLGDTAMAHLERLGREMLQLRQMSLPTVSANVPGALMKALMSAGVLAESGTKAVTFGHQTLLDVLAVRAAYRDKKSLLDFIGDQAATPFARPAVRSFFFYLRSADPERFRGQVRATLGSPSVAFHLKRLLTESLAEVEPQDADWPLIQHLYSDHSELFPTFYFPTKNPAWLSFLERHWWPVVVAEKAEQWALNHARHLGIWLQQQPDDVVNAWLAMFEVEWLPKNNLAYVVALALEGFSKWQSSSTRALFEKLLPLSRGKQHDFLGARIGAFVAATNSHDDLLWRFITRDVTEEALLSYHLDGKLRCAPHDLGQDHQILEKRMVQSERLLSDAIASVNKWSESIRARWSNPKSLHDNFLRETSYGQTHTRIDIRHVSSESVLFNAIEQACLQHARTDTTWWREHENELRQSHEAALRYIAIKAYTENPSSNLASIATVLVDREVLEYRWTFELGQLMRASFHLLDQATQDQVVERVLDLHSDHKVENDHQQAWIILKRRDYLRMVPAFSLTPAADELLRDASLRYGPASDTPHIEARSGWVAPPFSDEVLTGLSNDAILRIVGHYDGSGRGAWEYDSLIGGSDQVTRIVHEAASKQPIRFMAMLTTHWRDLPPKFRDEIFSGAAIHLRYRFGHLSSSAPWTPLETPPSSDVASRLIEELNRHPTHWRCKHQTAEALEACAWVIEEQTDAENLAFWLTETRLADDPQPDRQNGGMGLIGIAINSTRGITADTAMILATRWVEAGRPLPELLPPLLLALASDRHPAVRAVLLRRLPLLQFHAPELGWRVFARAISEADKEIWGLAEPCLYHAYHANFDKVEPHLDDVLAAGAGDSWGRIAALACLSGHIAFETLIRRLADTADNLAWAGVAQVFSSNLDKPEHINACLTGLTGMLINSPQRTVVASEVLSNAFSDAKPSLRLPAEFLQQLFSARSQGGQDQRKSLHGFMEWLENLVQTHVEDALQATEIMLASGDFGQDLDLWHLTSGSVLNRLFQEAEDREASDGGNFLRRVIAVQDVLLKSGTYGLDQWLKDAERP